MARTIVEPPLDQLQKGGEVLVKMKKSTIAGVFVSWNHRRVDSSGTVDVQSKCGQQGDPEEISKKRGGKKKSKVGNRKS